MAWSRLGLTPVLGWPATRTCSISVTLDFCHLFGDDTPHVRAARPSKHCTRPQTRGGRGKKPPARERPGEL